MTIPAWPSVNYAPLAGSWSCADINGPLKSDMNAGATRQRNKYTLQISVVQFDVVMTAAEVAAFRAWYQTTLGNGAARFSMQVWNGSAYVSRSCAFHDVPKYQQLGMAAAQKVTFQVKVEGL